MKNSFYISFLLVFVSFIWAIDPQGPTVYVELNSGTKQKAQYLGSIQDTIILGGYIQNSYTKIKLPKSAFKSILDSTGQSLFKTENEFSSKDTASTVEKTEALVEEKVEPISLKNKTVIIPLMRRGIDSVLAERLLHLTVELLSEQNKSIEITPLSFFSECKEMECIRRFCNEQGVEGLWNGEIVPAKSEDSLILKMERMTFSKKIPDQVQITIAAKTPLQSLLKEEKWVLFVQNKEIKKKKPKSYVFVETDPEGASVSKGGKSPICKTPCTFATIDTGKVLIETYWHVNQHQWGNQEYIQLIPEDTVKVSLRLKRVQPEIEISTNPLGALIFEGNDTLSIKRRPLGQTPKRIHAFEPGPASMRLWKEGYKDTLIEFHVNTLEKTPLSIDLTPLKDLNDIEKQQKWIKAKKVRFWGLTITGSAIAPIITGAIFSYLSHKDYEEARKIKKNLEQPSIADGAHFQELVDKNSDLVEKGDQKLIIGGSLFGLGAIMIGFGLTILF